MLRGCAHVGDVNHCAKRNLPLHPEAYFGRVRQLQVQRQLVSQKRSNAVVIGFLAFCRPRLVSSLVTWDVEDVKAVVFPLSTFSSLSI